MSEGAGECSLSHGREPLPQRLPAVRRPLHRQSRLHFLRPRDTADKEDPDPANGPSYREPLPVRGRPLFELGDPYFEANEVLGKFACCAHLHQLLYTWPITPSLSLCYLLRTFSGYGVKIVHINFLS